MKKIHWILVTFLGVIIAFSACSKTETYADKLKKESKAIDRFMKDNDIEFVDVAHLEDHIKFADNQFYKDPTGVYYHVIDYGDLSNMATVENLTPVILRYGPILDITNDNDTLDAGNQWQSTAIYTLSFSFGNTSTYQRGSNDYKTYGEYLEYLYLSPALTLPLQYVGDKAKVSMVVPFTAGSYYQNYTSYSPYYFTEIIYTLN